MELEEEELPTAEEDRTAVSISSHNLEIHNVHFVYSEQDLPAYHMHVLNTLGGSSRISHREHIQ